MKSDSIESGEDRDQSLAPESHQMETRSPFGKIDEDFIALDPVSARNIAELRRKLREVEAGS